MPPAPRITATVDAAKLAEVCKELRIDPPPIRIAPATGGIVNGTYDPASGGVTLYVGFDSESLSALRHVQGRIVGTLLHELRHAHQFTHWSLDNIEKGTQGHYFDQGIEEDARHFAATNRHRFRTLVRVSRKQHGSGFSKLARHAGRQVV